MTQTNTNATGSPLHLTGAVYQFAAASRLASKPLGQWNTSEIAAVGPKIKVKLNGESVSHLANPRRRPLKGHIGLQNHHPKPHRRARMVILQADVPLQRAPSR